MTFPQRRGHDEVASLPAVHGSSYVPPTADSMPFRRAATPLRVLVTLALLVPVPGRSQGFRVEGLDSARLTLSGRVQTQFTTTDAPGFASTEWALRRVRLEAAVRVNDLVSGKIQPEYAGSRVLLRDAFVQLDLHPALRIVAGQAHRPFSHVGLTSSTRIVPIERGVRLRGVPGARDHDALLVELGYSDRDVGLQALGTVPGAPLGLSYAVGMFNGPLRGEVATVNSTQLGARVALRPAPRLRVGAAWSRRQFVEDAGASAPVLRAGNAWEADLDLGDPLRGPRLMAEAAVGDTDPFLGIRFHAAQAWLSFRTGPVGRTISAVEPLLRLSHADPDAGSGPEVPEVSGGTLVTPGVNLWLGGLNRVAVNWDAWNPERGERRSGVKVMFQLVF